MTPAAFASIRATLGLTQAQLGEIIGITERQIRRIEAGATKAIKPIVAREMERLIAENSENKS